MMLGESTGGVIALLGPTNTGKTTRAIERMLRWDSGVMGFPLRLLARENYEYLCKKVGVNRVALVTGEERIIPLSARYVIATVESMPLQESFDFLGVDEIQMVADTNRGHVFTDRLLYHRGLRETVFVGSSSMSYLLERLIDGIKIFHYERFSVLRETGYQKISVLGKRTAVVAFSAKDVYQIGDTIRKNKGGVSVVMGTMSPEARRHQVDLYQSGEVNYMVATDAIGMGLNLTIDHIAFSSLYKFDGKKSRPLSVAEVGQIAGRAGRGERDGTYGTTSDVLAMNSSDRRNIPADFVQRIKKNNYPPIKKAYWRNPRLSFASPKKLLQGLGVVPPSRYLCHTFSLEDEKVLRHLLHSSHVLSLANGVHAVNLLWDVCQIPDYEKQFFRKRLAFLEELYQALHRYQGTLSSLWIEEKIKTLDKTEKNLHDLTRSLGRVRTWAYIVHRAGWVEEPQKWQNRLLDLESELSQNLHQCLVDRFVRNAHAHQGLREDYRLLMSDLEFDAEQKSVQLYGKTVAHLEGLSVEMAHAQISFPRKYLYKWLQDQEENYLAEFWQEMKMLDDVHSMDVLSLDSSGWIRWRGRVLGQCRSCQKQMRGACPFTATAKVASLSDKSAVRVQQLLQSYLEILWQKDFQFSKNWFDKLTLLGKEQVVQKTASVFLSTMLAKGGVFLWQELSLADQQVLKKLRKIGFFRKRLKILPFKAVYGRETMTPSHVRWRQMLRMKTAEKKNYGEILHNMEKCNTKKSSKEKPDKQPQENSQKLLWSEGEIVKRCGKIRGRVKEFDRELLSFGYQRVTTHYALRLDAYHRYTMFKNRGKMTKTEGQICFRGEKVEQIEQFLRSDSWKIDEKEDWIRQKNIQKTNRQGSTRKHYKKSIAVNTKESTTKGESKFQ